MKIKTIAVAAVIAASSGTVLADQIDVRFTGTGRGQNVRITYPTPSGPASQNVFAGQLLHDLRNGTGVAAGLSGVYTTFCTDVAQYVTSTTRRYDVVSISLLPSSDPMGADKAAAILDLYNFAAGTVLSSGVSNEMAAAFQLALWEIVTDYNPGVGRTSLNVTNGGFRATQTNGSALSSGVNTHLNSLFNAIGTTGAGGAVLLGLSSGSAQDQILTTVIPAPGALALAGMGLMGLARRRR